MINIISNHKCILNIDEIGNHHLSLVSVSGYFNPIILDKDDWIQFKDWTFKMETRVVQTSVMELNEYLSIHYHTLCPNDNEGEFFTDTFSMITTFPENIYNCSNRFKHYFGISNFPAEGLSQSESVIRVEGPSVMIIRCNGISTDMRCCIQNKNIDSILSNSIYASSISNVVSINLNTFATGFPFVLSGNDYIVNTRQLKYSEFEIVDIYGNPIQFINDIIWVFNISKIQTEYDQKIPAIIEDVEEEEEEK